MNFALAEMPLPLRFRPETPMSDEELMRFCAANEMVDLERDADGEICLRPLPGALTSIITARISASVGEWNRKYDKGVCFSHGGFTLPDGSMMSPAVAWVEHSIWNALSDEEQERYAPMCPQFVIEIVSSVRSRASLQAKVEQWIANGAWLAWLIDPIEQEVSVYRPGESAEVLHHPTSVQGNGVIAGFELMMARIWD